MEYAVYGAVIVGLFVFFFLKNSMDEKRRFYSILKNVRERYGKKPNKKYEEGELLRIRKMFEYHQSENSIDDITANDLDVDSVFKRMNYCKSSMGSEYLYYRLNTPINDREAFAGIEKKIKAFENDEALRMSFIETYLKIGNLKNMSFYDCLDYFETIPSRKPVKEIIMYIAMAISVGAFFINVPLGVILLVGTLVYGIISYYSLRGTIEPYIVSFGYIVNFVNQARAFNKIKSNELDEDLKYIKDATDTLKEFTKHASVVTGKQVSAVGVGNPLDLFADYGRMLFHIDIIRFYRMLDYVKKNIDLLDGLYIKLGELESYISIAYFRASLPYGYAIPTEGEKLFMEDGYHPLIDECVKNTIKVDKGVLITGSNASGKSTFLKTVALNLLLAETINTALCKTFSYEYMHLFSSMSLRDSLESKDSYFMVEIKAVKRIIDYKSMHPQEKVLCFVDEVLRGTNTVERIAAGCQILKGFIDRDICCFAATHDGELTILLDGLYDNYHFDEEILDDDVLFNYRLKEGRATSRNAIKLLNVMGYDSSIVESAQNMAQHFIDNGEWKAQ